MGVLGFNCGNYKFFLNPVEHDCLVLSVPSVSTAFSLLGTLYACLGALN